MKPHITSKKAQALMEFVLIFPLLLVVLFGLYQIGMALTIQQTITHAAREGARYGALTNDNSQIEGAVYTAIEFIDPENDNITIEITPENENTRQRGDDITVAVTYTLPFALFELFTEDITLSAQAIARIETN